MSGRRKKSEGLNQGCLAKGSKVGTGGIVAKMMVAITHGGGVIICERYKKMDAKYFASFIDQHFNTMFERSAKGLTLLWLRDGDPSQNSKTACEAMACSHCELLKIPPQSPDLNPIENIFHIASKKLGKDALNKGITHESYEEFCDRVQRTISGISHKLIDKTIQSRSGRITGIIQNNEERFKY